MFKPVRIAVVAAAALLMTGAAAPAFAHDGDGGHHHGPDLIGALLDHDGHGGGGGGGCETDCPPPPSDPITPILNECPTIDVSLHNFDQFAPLNIDVLSVPIGYCLFSHGSPFSGFPFNGGFPALP